MNFSEARAKMLCSVVLSCFIVSCAIESTSAQTTKPAAPDPAQSNAATDKTAVNPQSKTSNTDQSNSSAPTIASIDVKPGDHWTYKIYDDITGDLKGTTSFVVTELQGETYSVQASFTPTSLAVGQPATLDVFDSNWNIIEDPVWKRKPYDPVVGVKFPLSVGAHWDTTFTTERQNPSMKFAATATSKVVGWENVKLRFGLAYDAFRIETTIQYKTSSDNKSFDQKSTFWYAPQVNRYVKHITENRQNGRLSGRTIEYLVQYSRRSED